MNHGPGLVVYQTPGHTPDEVAVWDPQERYLFVGDTLYEWAPIIFPLEGSLFRFSESLGRLKTLVSGWNAEKEGEHACCHGSAKSGEEWRLIIAPESSNSESIVKPRVKIACGHATKDSDAEELLRDVDYFLYRVTQNLVPPVDRGSARGESLQAYEREDGKLSFLGPKRLFDEFRADRTAMETLVRRQPTL